MAIFSFVQPLAGLVLPFQQVGRLYYSSYERSFLRQWPIPKDSLPYQEACIAEFKKVFKSKTGNEWDAEEFQASQESMFDQD
ncbi:hypothetical protein BCR33DRAFT_207017 [Rhizoclosmatium globosum]|uniref:Uncharacterized protein n=1 Tax=Rhizoclosmatium globosum TaxID=329046 RepID=A0A1Y2CCB8_9FUNG|nr:hypothetical protein BCR33DRAFT_207017 [Rhizoclosmatium globosum]|eukprot:ORY44690.1 hypothetical protein BCR33DRAFT_207017 [Rhizoclosmatium globosum]